MNADAPADRYGLAFGVILAMLGLLNGGIVIANVATVYAGLSLIACIVFLAAMWLLFESGSVTARAAGTVASGASAGAIAGFLCRLPVQASCAGFLGGAGFALSLSAGDYAAEHLVFYGAETVTGTVFAAAVLGCFFAGVGGGMGALGALFRQSRARGRPQTQP